MLGDRPTFRWKYFEKNKASSINVFYNYLATFIYKQLNLFINTLNNFTIILKKIVKALNLLVETLSTRRQFVTIH